MSQRAERSGDPMMMLISAALFGFFGFVIQWNVVGMVSGQTLPFMVLFVWTMRITAIWYLLSALLVFTGQRVGYFVYAIGGLVSAVALVVVTIMDLMDGDHTVFMYAEFLLPIFAVWNGWSSWRSLQEITGRPEAPAE